MSTEALVGHVIVSSLEAQDVERVFLVPGESFLGILDGLHGSGLESIVCRHEGGAAYMAEAQGKLTGRPGIAMVTRGPGAANAFVAVHAANQDATPMVLFVGLVPISDRDRFSFQEFDPHAWFGSEAKAVYVLDDPDQAAELVSKACSVAASGRPGPVIIGVPEDVLLRSTSVVSAPARELATSGVSREDLHFIHTALAAASRPLFFVGGPHWSPEAAALLERVAQNRRVPVLHDWRASDRVSFTSPCNGGWLGYGRDASAARAFEESDLVITIGAVHGDAVTDGFVLRQDPALNNVLISLDPELRGHSGGVLRQILASPERFLAALAEENATPNSAEQTNWYREVTECASIFRSLDAAPRPSTERTGIDPREVFADLIPQLPENAIFTFGAGNHCAWAQRYLPTLEFPSQLGMRNGSMGYSIPAAVAASLHAPDRLVVAVCGDGELLMNGQELATAAQYGARLLVLVLDNGVYGTIRDHQQAQFPGRPSGIELQNPDFAAWARSFGAFGAEIRPGSPITETLIAAMNAIEDERRSALIRLSVDPLLDLP